MERPQEAAGMAAAEVILELYDACWFRGLVLLPSPAPAPPEEREVEQPELAPKAGLRHRRTRSDEAAAAAFQDLEPLRIPHSGHRARLGTILSGKDGALPLPMPAPPPPPEQRRPRLRQRQRRRRGRSLSELEFEEVKGLRDLGFTFSDADVDAELASIVPGLRRHRSDEAEVVAAASAPAALAAHEQPAAPGDAAPPRRPYLSEAWEEEEVRAKLRNWRIPAAVDRAVLEQNLRMWAHTVASAVR